MGNKGENQATQRQKVGPTQQALDSFFGFPRHLVELVRLVLPVLRRPQISAADFEAVAQEVPQVLGIVLGFNCLGCGWPA